MFMETPQTLIILTGGAFLLGWLVGKIGAYFGNKFAAKSRDPRDDGASARLRRAGTALPPALAQALLSQLLPVDRPLQARAPEPLRR